MPVRYFLDKSSSLRTLLPSSSLKSAREYNSETPSLFLLTSQISSRRSNSLKNCQTSCVVKINCAFCVLISGDKKVNIIFRTNNGCSLAFNSSTNSVPPMIQHIFQMFSKHHLQLRVHMCFWFLQKQYRNCTLSILLYISCKFLQQQCNFN